MSEHFHVLVWIDHQLAKVIGFNTDEADSSTVHSTHLKQHLHHKVNAGDSGHVAVDTEYLERVAIALKNAGAILITGPASAKKELIAHIKREHPEIAERVSGVQTVDHPTDGELVNLGRRFFRADDRMHAQKH
jgi:stalled ribosome rescue protein Dom34